MTKHQTKASTSNYVQLALSFEEQRQVDTLCETAAASRFRNDLGERRAEYATYDAYLGQDGSGNDLSRNTRRQIMNALRKSCSVLGIGQKSRIGRLGAGSAIGAAIMGFGPAALAQYSAGGGNATGLNAISIGVGSTSLGIQGVAVGTNSDANAQDDIAIGTNASANSGANTGGIAVGANSNVENGSGVAIGERSEVRNTAGGSNQGVAIGSLARANVTSATGGSPVAIGTSANATGGGSQVAIGDLATATGLNAVAIGGHPFSAPTAATGDFSLAFGASATASGTNSIAIGGSATGPANATGLSSVAIGDQAEGLGSRSLALGFQAFAGQNGDGTAPNQNQFGGIAIGDGARAETEANGSTIAIGRGAAASSSTDFGDSIALGTDATASGLDSLAIGGQTTASGDRSIGIGNDFTAAGGTDSIAIGVGSTATAVNATALGNGADATATGATVIGQASAASGIDSVAIGRNVTATADNTVVIGSDGTTATVAGAVAIGPGHIDHRAAGCCADGAVFDGTTGAIRGVDIIVGGQNYPTITAAIEAGDAKADNANSGLADALGGGAAVAPDGTVTAPSYAVQGNISDNVGDAIAAVDGSLTNLGDAVTNLTDGTSGLVQQDGGAPGAGEITVGKDTGGTSINIAGTDGERVVTGVADGAVTAVSSDAVNGSQLFGVQQVADGALQRSGGTLTGSIDAGGNRITNLAAPVNGGDATNKDYVDGVAASAAATTTNVGTSTANHFGGGATYDPATGNVSAPSYSVGGQSYNNVGTAIAATNMLAVQYVPDASGQPTNAVRLGTSAGAPPVALGNVAAGAVNATSTDAVNGGQLFAVQTVADGALQRTGGTLTGNLNLSGNRVTGLAAPIEASDAATRGYVDALNTDNVNKFNLLTSGLNNAFSDIERNSQGVALAIAMGGGFLSDDKDFSLWGAWGNFNGYNAAALQTYIRLSDDAYLNAGASFGFEESLVGTRVGFGIQF